MEGKYIELSETEKNTKYARVVFHLDNNHKLCYDDSRSFGRMIINDEANYLKEKEIAKLGPEPFDVSDVTFLINKTKKISLPIKTALLSQELITGLGNIYVDEVCFASGLNPLENSGNVTLSDCEKIIKESRRILKEAIDLGGSTIKSYHPKEGVNGEMQNELLVYNHPGVPCPHCGKENHRRRKRDYILP